MFLKIGVSELILVFVVALFALGPDRLPEYARKLGEAVAQFKKYSDEATKDIKESVVEPLKEAQRPLKEAMEPLQDLDQAVRTNAKDIQKSALHPTQKPVALIEELIKTYSNPGDTILDSCAGSCTTAVAAIKTNRNYICIEKDSEFYQIGLKRVLKIAAAR